ncbi:MAG TPA: hypothetical protein VK749_07765 [Xanthobacteraceae bacterium]|nr:hypothetical protein [Xanthobacteraceae bacterium]
MRVQLAAFTIIATVVASPAWAQTTAPASVFMSDKDITALVDKAKADRKGDAPVTAEPILLLAPYRAQLEYRPGNAPAALHEHDAELMVVLQGTGDIVTEGKLVDEKRVNANNLTGSSISGGASPPGGQGRYDPDPLQHPAPSDPERRHADRADDHARAISGNGLAARELDHDPIKLNPIMVWLFRWRMIFSENRHPLLRITL